ncbi:erythromycin esterase family protein [Lewinella sp. IMCC34191]|uniref:erythromycin esterase family protein n=1 Tax=Lewinella sp. IMCC34191 TaxID=2259172 RepID=UPI000E25EF58|nr:erythromycin esterase family protein [Lewinella sp. IMCC34191]
MRKLWLIPFFGLAFYLRTAAQCPPQLGNYTTNFSAIEAAQFTFLDNQLDSVNIVGYGEDTHGTAEFTLLAQELLKYLVERHGFTGIVLETMVGEGVYLDDYVQGKRDDRDFLLEEVNSSWRYRTEEFVKLLEWMREYNREHPQARIHLYGSEMQFVQADAQLLRDYFAELGHEVGVAPYDKHIWNSFSPEERTALFDNYRAIQDYLILHGEELERAGSRETYERMLHHAEVIGQFVLTINQPKERHKSDLRDLYMAENVLRPLHDGSKDVRLLYWAHNAHAGDWVSNGQVDVAGHQLRKRMGKAYYNLATDFGNGSFRALAPKNEGWSWQIVDFELDPDTFTACLAAGGAPYTFLNLRRARLDTSLAAYLNAPLRIMSGAGAQYYGESIRVEDVGRAFDGIIYLDRVHSITVLPNP